MLGLRTAIYMVSDMEKAKTWYSEAFGQQPYFEDPFYIGFNIGGYELGLRPEKSSNEKPESVLAYWGVTQIQKEYDRLLGMGATSHEVPANVGGELMVATVKDPWGNILGLIYNPYFKLV
ncbi:VOC family protein [Spongiimicrobium sp. 3-5]|uniref:VOC family protein n=1 Tax=Spongiimicrobium sp. 3-5 TaxID=3332596 RepID=UPI003980CE64